MSGEAGFANPLEALVVAYRRLAAFVSERRAARAAGESAAPDGRPKYWTLPLHRAVCAVPLLPTPLDASSIDLSPAAPLAPAFVNLDHARVFAAAGFVSGFLVGAHAGGRLRRLQFLAENAHRMPRTKAGWYFYLRERNYQVLKRAGAVGARTGAKWALVLGGFAALETAVDLVRLGTCRPASEAENAPANPPSSFSAWLSGATKLTDAGPESEDFKSTIIAGLTTQLVLSRLYSLRVSPRTLGYGLAGFALLGLAQDAYRRWAGESSKYAYLEIIGPAEGEDPAAAAARRRREEEERRRKGGAKGAEDEEGGGWSWPWAPKEVNSFGSRKD
ncbi:hypothetical protein DFJ74DRAFT_757068 [Hyaloraphidium curvatum]|nr:hypothetical protein DFJ74DRAFT_757068 [Hyaloraphidium curvatum]